VVDLQDPAGAEVVLRLVEQADVLVEGFRPGVVERLGVGPDVCFARNPKLVYGRMTGWGQEGPFAELAGHDLDYIAVTGLLWGTGRPPDKPVPPLNLYGDYGGGSLFLVYGIACALVEARTSGRGQVVDAAMVDGAAVLSTSVTALRATGRWSDERGANVVDTGYPHYEVYECADGAYFAVAALEPQFYRILVELTGFEEPPGDRLDPTTRAERKRRWAELFRTRTRAEWDELLGDTDACAAPVLDWAEAPAHRHLAARGTYVEYDGIVQPAPAPRFSRTPGAITRVPPAPGAHTDELLSEVGWSAEEIAELRAVGTVA
jgi:alpha-methylacyl-CoA racemase